MIWSAAISHASAKDTTAILLFGDSIIAGYGLRAEETVPFQLQAILRSHHEGISVINGGVSGDTTGAGRNRLAWALNKHNPDIVVLALGGNDVLRGISPQVTKENLSAMLALLAQRGIPTILSSVQAPHNFGLAYSNAFNSIYTNLAEQYGTPLYPFLISETFGKAHLMQPDGIHPNANGALLIAQNLAQYLRQSPLLKTASNK